MDAAALDARILAAIARYELDEAAFLRLARDLLAYQLAANAPYAAFAASRGVDGAHVPERIAEIPAVPAAAFKEARLATFPPDGTAVWFETSGTTFRQAQGRRRGHGGRHELPTTTLYEAALLASFDRMLLADRARLRYLLLVPDVRERPHSSLGFMMDVVARERGDGATGWYLHDDELDVERFLFDVDAASATGVAVCLATTAFALVALLDTLAERGRSVALPPGSRVMETGGFKGRTRVVDRTTLYRETSKRLGVPIPAIVAEYGMTELSSQYYDAPASRDRIEPRVKLAPPWLRPLVVDGEGHPLPDGVVGAIRHIDLANRGSVIAIDTEDLGALVPASDRAGQRGLILLGREQGAELRGCSLDAEALLTSNG